MRPNIAINERANEWMNEQTNCTQQLKVYVITQCGWSFLPPREESCSNRCCAIIYEDVIHKMAATNEAGKRCGYWRDWLSFDGWVCGLVVFHPPKIAAGGEYRFGISIKNRAPQLLRNNRRLRWCGVESAEKVTRSWCGEWPRFWLGLTPFSLPCSHHINNHPRGRVIIWEWMLPW